ncbi:uncharacterized protein RCC_06289 [Lecanosticta acicola]|uniref:Uncharacterized protein RCC_06289 n=1 Tax=Lecanosticta acicola TaxID=111012 RepID=A0AAI8YUG4_9PEZI|nr:uncharacterized protein RCC_06289 [Lecanosticta acicola]
MPATRQTARKQADSTVSLEQQQFRFPEESHLLITTPRHVFAWDSTGMQTIFSSRRGSIVAAKEAKDGSGLLAVASSHVVVMHDTQRGQEESWGLDAPNEQVRHLEYAPDAKSLFLSTTADGSIQHYSMESSRMLQPTHKHDAAPVALAVSPTGHLILSASHQPPVIFLKNMTHNSSPVQMLPNASAASVSHAAFHPERPNIYLLAFRDGTVAAYDATKAPRHGSSESRSVVDGEIASIRNVHRAVVTGDEVFDKSNLAAPLAGAAFLPGFKTRAVTAGRDGKCKLVDFARGGVVLRTWHVRAPLTSLSVLALRSQAKQGDTRKRSSASHTIGGPTTTDCVIATSRVDGQVHLYDSVGLLRAQKTVSAQEERILSVEWAKGPAPRSVGTTQTVRRFSEETSIAIPDSRTDSQRPNTITSSKASPPNSGTRSELGLPSELKQMSNTAPRRFTLHPNEMDASEGTVRYIPSPVRAPPVPLAGAEYHDLFSPVKPMDPVLNSQATRSLAKERVTSPGRNRPRLSSQTFVHSPETKHNGEDPMVSRSSAAATSTHDATSAAIKERPHPGYPPTLRPSRQTAVHMSPLTKTKRHIKFKHGGDGSTNVRGNGPIAAVNSNAKILADLRKLATGGTSQRKHGTLSSYAASQHRIPAPSPRSGATQEVAPHPVDTAMMAADSDSVAMEPVDGDIWLTSESEPQPSHAPRRRRRKATATVSSNSNSVSRTTAAPANTAAAIPTGMTAPSQVDGSTEEEMFATAPSRLSPNNGTFSPASEDVRELFPRSSSLSPRQRRSAKRKSPLKEAQHTSVAINGALGRRPEKSPWARAKAEKGGKSVQVLEDPPTTTMSGALPRSEEGLTCLSCPETKARVQALEGEVAHLKGEVLALKAMLRRNGLPVSAGIR